MFTEDRFLTNSKLVALTGGLLIVMAGWLFSIMIGVVQHTRDRQETIGERVAHLEAAIEVLRHTGCGKPTGQ